MNIKTVLILISICFLHIQAKAQVELLSDEFNRRCSFYDWQEVNTVEQWNASHLESRDIDSTNTDRLTLMPWSTAWYQNYRSNLLFKEITGDFVFTTSAEVSNRAGNGVPATNFSLGGIMIRIPTEITPATWTIGLENYIFLSIGRATSNSQFQYERKSTTNSSSQLEFYNIGAIGAAELRIVKKSNAVLVFIRVAGQSDFDLQYRYNRPDMVDTTLQAGFVAYTDWPKVQTYSHDTSFYNSHAINADLNPDPGIPARIPNPDIIAQFDYARFDEINLAPQYDTLDLSDINQVTDAELEALFGYAPTPHEEIGWKIWRGEDSNWDNVNNWSGGSLPMSSDSILIPNCGCAEVVFPTITTQNITYSSIMIEQGGQLTIEPNAQLTIDLSGSNARFINQGSIYNEGLLDVTHITGKEVINTGTLQCSDDASCNFEE